MSFGQQYPQQFVQQPVVQSSKPAGLSAGEHRRALGTIMLAIWIGVACNAVTAICSTIQEIRAYKAQQQLDDARSNLENLFKSSPLDRKSTRLNSSH